MVHTSEIPPAYQQMPWWAEPDGPDCSGGEQLRRVPAQARLHPIRFLSRSRPDNGEGHPARPLAGLPFSALVMEHVTQALISTHLADLDGGKTAIEHLGDFRSGQASQPQVNDARLLGCQ